MKETETQVKKVAESFELFKHSSLIIEEKTLGILKHVEYVMKRQQEEINCLVEYVEIVDNFRENMREFKSQLDQIVWPAISGTNNVALDPNILNPETLRKIIEVHVNKFRGFPSDIIQK